MLNRFPAYLAILPLMYCVAGIAVQDDASRTESKGGREPKKIRVETDLQEVLVVVTDKEGRIVENLAKNDFELLENDRLQEISFFTVSEVESISDAKSAPEAGKPEQPAGTPVSRATENESRSVIQKLESPPARTTLLFVDNLHLSFGSLNWVKQALHRFINEQMTDRDMVSLATSHTLGVAQEYTRDRRLLHYAVEQISYGAPVVDSRSLFTPNIAAGVLDEKLDESIVAREVIIQEDRIENQAENCPLILNLMRNKATQVLSRAAYDRRNTLSILRAYAEQMTDLPGKRMIVVFSEGFLMHDSSGVPSNPELEETVHRAVRSGVVIYTIDARGPHTPVTIDAGRSWVQPISRPPVKDEDPRCYLLPTQDMLQTYIDGFELEKLNGLHTMAAETGGSLYEGSNNLNDLLGRAFDANRYFYVLSYYVPEAEDTDRFRKIEVSVRNHPEYSIRAPRGFSLKDRKMYSEDESAGTPQQQLLRAMNRPLPVTDLGVSATADYLETEHDDKKVSLTVNFVGDRFRYRPEGGFNVVELEILTVFYDSSGKQVDGISAQVEGRLTPGGMERAQTSGYRFSRRLALEPGVYRARIGVREKGTERIGTATTWIEVPGLKPDRLEMSSLILSNPLDLEPFETEKIEVNSLEQVRMVQGVPVYEKDDIFYYTFRVHAGCEHPENQASEEPELLLAREVLKEGKPVETEKWYPVKEANLNADSKGWIDLDGELDISRFDPGVYELRVRVKDVRSNKTAERTAAFGIL
ncbi:MAG: VWA domain-containing protein [Acidobacteria bacterium]|nr:VWA domain-containing protein [Acidobacteriota bacterium]